MKPFIFYDIFFEKGVHEYPISLVKPCETQNTELNELLQYQ